MLSRAGVCSTQSRPDEAAFGLSRTEHARRRTRMSGSYSSASVSFVMHRPPDPNSFQQDCQCSLEILEMTLASDFEGGWVPAVRASGPVPWRSWVKSARTLLAELLWLSLAVEGTAFAFVLAASQTEISSCRLGCSSLSVGEMAEASVSQRSHLR